MEQIELEECLKNSAGLEDWQAIADSLPSLHPAAAAAFLQTHCKDNIPKVCSLIRRTFAADLLEALPDDIAAQVLHHLLEQDPQFATRVVRAMRTDETADILQDISNEDRNAILSSLTQRDAEAAAKLLSYPEDTAGGLMQTELISIPVDSVAAEVVGELRSKVRRYSEYPATYLYVVDTENRLVGTVTPRALLLCDADTPLSEIMNGDPTSIPVDLPAEEVVNAFRDYHYLALPVVDDKERLLGVVTHRAAMEEAEEQADEELLEMVGIVGGEEFRDNPLWSRSWRRLSWLGINVLLNMIAASVIAVYAGVIEAVVAIAVFLPIISDMSGCAGNQAIAVSIRELSTGRTRPKDYLRVLWKEMSVGFINGPALGVLIGVVAWLWYGNAWLGVIVGLALALNTFVALALGSLIPLGLRAVGKDPALASGPILTTITDLCGFWILLALAAWAIRNLGLS
ncbi:MAG: magnesium transporter [Candidatus Omnitrophica bacterium]|nr:magnesium transporter [Candidatus Omnitrophota bacterium]